MFCTRIGHYPRVHALFCSILIFCFVFALSGCGSSSSDAPPNPVPPEASNCGDDACGCYAAWVMDALIGGLTHYVAEQSIGWLLSLIKGGGSSDSAAFKDMNKKLNEIIGDLKAIESTLEEVLGLINLKTDEILAQEAYLEIKPALDLIALDYSNLQALQQNPTKDAAGQLAEAFINSDNMEYQIEQIYTAVMGTTPGVQGGILDESTTVILDQETGIDATQLLNSYRSLETIFTQLVEYQLQAAAMEVEGLHWRDNPWVGTGIQGGRARVRSAVGSEYPGTAGEFITTWFQPRLDDEVEEFLRCVDRIVCSQLDLRTDIATTSPTVAGFMPSTVDQIYFRADFIAAQFSSRHQFGLNVRLVGEATTVADIAGGAAQVQNQDGDTGAPHNMTLVPLGLTTETCYPIRCSAVEKWWNWPDGYDQTYAEWNWATFNQPDNPNVPTAVSGHIEFGYSREIVASKYNDADPIHSSNLVVKTTYPHEAASFNSNGAPMPGWYDDAMNPVSAGTDGAHEYGHATLAIRHRPDAYYYYLESATTNDAAMFTLSVTHGVLSNLAPYFSASGGLVDNPSDDEGNFNVESGIAMPIINGTTWQQKMSVSGNLQGNYQEDIPWIRGSTMRAYAYWLSASGTEGDYWDLQEDTTNYSYGTCGAYHHFNSTECCPFHMAVGLDVVVNGAWGGQADSATIWPETLYLWF